jgi:hypothetical protein
VSSSRCNEADGFPSPFRSGVILIVLADFWQPGSNINSSVQQVAFGRASAETRRKEIEEYTRF